MSYTAVVEVRVDGVAVNYTETEVCHGVALTEDGTLLLVEEEEIVQEYGPGDWVRLTLTPAVAR